MSEKFMNCNYGHYSASPGNAIKSPTGTFRTQKISYSTDANAAWLYPETQLCDLEPLPSRLNLESGALFFFREKLALACVQPRFCHLCRGIRVTSYLNRSFSLLESISFYISSFSTAVMQLTPRGFVNTGDVSCTGAETSRASAKCLEQKRPPVRSVWPENTDYDCKAHMHIHNSKSYLISGWFPAGVLVEYVT